MRNFNRLALAVLGLVSLVSIIAAQDKKAVQKSLDCLERGSEDRLKTHCEIKELTLTAGAISVDGRQNGGVKVKGWDRNEVLVRYRIESRAPTKDEADQLASQVTIATSNRRVHAEGPEGREDHYWSVGYEVFVPYRTDLSLQAQNGGIAINDVQGKLEFSTTNGGVHLSGVGGSVRGGTTNGGLHVDLTGTRWEGETLDVKTTNGGVHLSIPEGYSAHLETGTTNGRVRFGFAVNVPTNERGRYPNQISTDLGSGGPTIRVITTNGSVHVGRPTLTD
jgi:DUF4097 and DUF4098 domain-containing protein YvlB